MLAECALARHTNAINAMGASVLTKRSTVLRVLQSNMVGLQCTRKNGALVEFALGDLSNQIFVSRYAVELPKKAEMERFIAQLSKEVAA